MSLRILFAGSLTSTERRSCVFWLSLLLFLFFVCNQPARSTQPGHPLVGRPNEYRPKGGDALRLGSKGRYGSCVGGR